MAKSNIDKLVDDPKKILFIVIIIVIIIVVVWIFWGKIKTLFSNLGNKVQQNAELNDYINQTGETFTLSESEIRNLANKLEQAFYGNVFGWGTDENAVYEVFNRINNGADLRKQISVYGTRHDMTLNQAIVDELGRSELNKVNTILSNKGIDYAF